MMEESKRRARHIGWAVSTKAKGYSTIPSTSAAASDDDDDDSTENTKEEVEQERLSDTGTSSRYSNTAIFCGGASLVLLAIASMILVPSWLAGGQRDGTDSTDNRSIDDGLSLSPSSNWSSSSSREKGPLPMPHGVNLGSWLSLEDYFFVGTGGAVEVATPSTTVAARCLPPLYTGSSTTTKTGPKYWHSETDLFGNLTQQHSVQYAIRTFEAFRVSYMDYDEELPRIAKLGIKAVRVPVSWCLTDHDPSQDDLLRMAAAADSDTTSASDGASSSSENRDYELLQRYTCPDPFFKQDTGSILYWPAVPRPFLVKFLRACGRHGIKATLDVHTYPGGTSPGTFSGVWPRPPLFWNHDQPEDKDDEDVGRGIFRNLLTWLESLSKSDPDAFAGLGGITPMNEPAHLAGLFDPDNVNSFLPPLPDHMARDYLAELNKNATESKSSKSDAAVVPDGPHLRVLMWQRDAVAAFRSTLLPKKGIDLLVNVHESIFASRLAPNDANDPGGRHPQATSILAVWWRSTTTATERRTWAVLDMHHYHAWEPNCQGAVDGHPYMSAAYTCGDVKATDATLAKCTAWADVYRNALEEGEKEEDHHHHRDHHGSSTAHTERLASGEFSTSTHHSVLHSCTDTTTLRKSYLAQVEAAKKTNVELYYWAWKMPFGDDFRPAWSFQHLLYRLGVDGFSRPDESEIVCG